MTDTYPGPLLDPDDRPDFVKAFMYAKGICEVPSVFFLWTAYSLIAACCERAIYYEKFAGSPSYVNLYVFLIGESGDGKNVAIDFGYDLAKHHPIKIFRGNLTAKGMVDHLATRRKPGESEQPYSDPMYFITPELKMAMGQAAYADQMIAHMTEMYSGKDYPLGDRNRTRGYKVVKSPMINWLAGTTPKWLLECISRSSIEGGFFARCVPAVGQRDYNVRITVPIMPPNKGEMIDYLHERIKEFINLEGKFEMTREARQVDNHWYKTRPEPDVEGLGATWVRQQDLAHKLAVLSSLSESSTGGIVEKRHMLLGQQLSQICIKNTPHLIHLASLTPGTSCVYFTEKIVHRAKQIRHSELLVKLAYRYNAQQVAEAEELLTLQRKIRIEEKKTSKLEGGKKVKWIKWIGSGGRLKGY